jgi:hypothetical protein
MSRARKSYNGRQMANNGRGERRAAAARLRPGKRAMFREVAQRESPAMSAFTPLSGAWRTSNAP